MHQVAGMKFKTKKELETYTRNYLRDNLDSSLHQGDKGYGFLRSLVSRHPDFYTKISSPIRVFKIHKNFGGHVALSLIDREGEKSISWKKCVTQLKTNWITDLRAVCRQEVTSQVQSHKDEHYFDGMKCPSCCKEIPSRKAAHVDHKTTPFRDIFDSFVGLNFNSLPSQFKPAGLHVGYEFRDEDIYIRKAWVEYHKEKADYQILCAGCNLKKK